MKLLKKEMKLLGMNNSDLASILKVSNGSITNWLTGAVLPRAIHVRRMIEVGISKQAALNPSKDVEI